MSKVPAQVKAILDLEFPTQPDKVKLCGVETKVHRLFLLLCSDREWEISKAIYPALFEKTPDTPKMIRNRAKAQMIMRKYYRTMTSQHKTQMLKELKRLKLLLQLYFDD